MFVPDTIHTTTSNLFPFPFRRLEILLISRIDPEQFTEGFRFEMNCPRLFTFIRPHLKPFIHILLGSLQSSTLRMVRLNVLDEIFCVFPIGFIGLVHDAF